MNMDFNTIGAILVLSLSWMQSTTAISPALILTQYIQNNKTMEARNLATVSPALFLNKTSYSGFLTIDPRFNSNTFFWYFPVEGKPVGSTPWIIWLQGGPGASSLVGLFNEIGPFEFVQGELKARKYAWTGSYSVLFLDNPIGAGYSFTDSEQGFARNMSMYANHLYSALQQFLTLFPELRKAPLFIAGESYAGRYVPALGMRIMQETQLTEEWQITLEGLIMGNPILNREDVANLTAVFYQWGLVDSQGVLATKEMQDGYARAVAQGNNQVAYLFRDKLLDKLQDMALQQQLYNPLVDEYHFHGFEEYIAQEEVREALHVGQVRFTSDNNTVKEMLAPDFLSDVQVNVEKLLEKYKVLIYCGQLDLTAPCVPNAEVRRSKWHWSHKEEFLNAPRVPWWYNESVAGYVKSGGGFTEALVRGAGHMVPVDKPAQAFEIISSFIRNVDMDLPPNYQPVKEDNPIPHYPVGTVIKTTPTTTLPSTTKVKNITKAPDVDEIKHNDAKGNVTRSKNSSLSAQSTISSKIAVEDDGISPGTIVSVVLNVVLVLIVAVGAFLYYRLKRRSEDFFYNNVENNSDDIFLT